MLRVEETTWKAIRSDSRFPQQWGQALGKRCKKEGEGAKEISLGAAAGLTVLLACPSPRTSWI